jgi:DNA modification methylase
MNLINEIHCGDSRTLIKDVPSESVDLVICSPAYFNQREYSSKLEMGQEATVEEYITSLVNFFKSCVRITKSSGSIIFNLGDKYIHENLLLVPYRFAIEATKQCDVNLINNITWAKSNPTPRQFAGRMVQATEPFFHFVKKGFKYKYYRERLAAPTKKREPNPDSKIGQSYYELIENSILSPEQKELARKELQIAINKVKSGEIASMRMKITGIHAPAFGGQEGGRASQMRNKGYTIIEVPGNYLVKDWFASPVESIRGIGHLAIYPQSIIEKFIMLATDEGDLVCDPFMGSGTTACAAKKLNRHYLGFELSKQYVDIAEKRLQEI